MMRYSNASIGWVDEHGNYREFPCTVTSFNFTSNSTNTNWMMPGEWIIPAATIQAWNQIRERFLRGEIGGPDDGLPNV